MAGGLRLDEIVAEIRRLGGTGKLPIPLVAAACRHTQLPRVRIVPAASFYAEASEAETAAIAARLPLARHEFLIGARTETPPSLENGPGEASEASTARILGETSDRLNLAFRSERPALLVVATTFDPGWHARSGESPLPIYETAAGYMAIALPAGDGVVELSFSDPWWRVGGAVSAATALAFLLARLRSRRRDDRRAAFAAA